MKTIIRLFTCLTLFCSINIMAQAPEKFNYQGVARNNTGAPIVSSNISLRLSITDGVTTLYAETFSATTSSLGLFNVEVGGGTVESGIFSSIDWSTGAKFIKVEMDPAGGISYIDMGTSQLLSVPYALYAQKSTAMNLNDLQDVNASAPSTNQVLQWNGTEWVPATISGGSGDNWGSQSVVTTPELTGNGTSVTPLTIAQQGATNGQVLRWNGVSWAPGTISGDNWGSQSISASFQFTGNGTPVSPLMLAQQGATTGQNLEWNGAGWVPADDDGIILPYSGTFNHGSPVLSVTNIGTGTPISGINNSTNSGVYGTEGYILSTLAGTNSAGVYGKNNCTSSNGAGVKGEHAGNGYGVSGTANGATGIGVYGVGSNTGGVGVIGTGNYGVQGTSNQANGRAIYGNATSGGFGGYFDGRTWISSNSNSVEPNLMLAETEASDYARLRMVNGTVGQFWEINALTTGTAATETFNIWNGIGGPLITVKGNGNVGIGTSAPVYKLHVNGNLAIAGPFMPFGNAGTTGQVLQSNGSGTAPSWVSSTNTLYNNTYFWDQSASLYLSSGVYQPVQFNGSTEMNFTVAGTSKILATVNLGEIVSSLGGAGGDTDLDFNIQLLDNLNNIVNQSFSSMDLRNDKAVSFSFTHHCILSTPGTYKLKVMVRANGNTDVYVSYYTIPVPNNAGQVNLQVIPQ